MKEKKLMKIIEYCKWIIDKISVISNFHEFVNDDEIVYSTFF